MTRKRTTDPSAPDAAMPIPVGAPEPADASLPYQVGYRQPPLNTRFGPGQSGNPRGRPKGRLNASEALTRELDEKISVREDGKTIRMSKWDAMIKRLVADALSGKKYAVDAVLAHERAISQASGATVHSDEDAAILERVLARVGAPQPGE